LWAGWGIAQDKESKEESSTRRPLVLHAMLENETITPGTAGYILRAIDEAESRQAECLIISLDTPGGLLESTRQLVKRFLNSRVCIVVYVSPAGSRAASAGVFITMASHVAVMAPGTTIGAAHPVSIGGLPFQPSEEPESQLRSLFTRPFMGLNSEIKNDRLSSWGDGRREFFGGHGEFLKLIQAVEDPAGVPTPQIGPSDEPPGSTPESSLTAQGEADEKSEASKSEKPAAAEKNAKRASSPMEEKIVNDTVSWAQALAEERGRNAEWIVRAVRESVSITDREAVELKVVDLQASDLNDLLEKLDGRLVQLPQGPYTLRTKGATLEQISMWWGERLLSLLSHPQVALILLIFGFYGVLFELYSPGWGVPGTVGLICLLLGLYGLSVLPVNYLGLGLIVVAFGLFVGELFVASYGLLTLAGVACMILGGLMLIESPTEFSGVSLNLIVPIAFATGAIVFLLMLGVLRSHRGRVQTGDEDIAGQVVEAKTDFTFQEGQYVGKVLVHGEWWQASSDQPIRQGTMCSVLRRDGLTLCVQPKTDSAEVSRFQ